MKTVGAKRRGRRLGADAGRWGSREDAAIATVRRVLVRAEEHYPADPDATLGTWFARVAETIAVAARVTVGQLEARRLLVEDDVATEQAAAFADICAEAVRAASRLCGGDPAKSSEEILAALAAAPPPAAPPGWDDLLEDLARCSAALEPVAGGLRDGDLPMDREAIDAHLVMSSMCEVARCAFRVVYVFCA